jgi:signal transduction histidine kinase
MLGVCWTCHAYAGVPGGNAATILILNSYEEDAAPYFRVREVFMQHLQQINGRPIHFRQFDLGASYEANDYTDDMKAAFLRTEYGSPPPDLVVAIGPPAIRFWRDYRSDIFHDVPSISAASERVLATIELPAADGKLATEFSFAAAVEGIRQLLPDTRHLVVVVGSSAYENSLAELAKRELADNFDNIHFEYTNGLSLAAIQQRLQGLSTGSAVLFTTFESDVNGVLLSGYSGLAFVHGVSTVPVFGPFDNQLGRGIMGGRLIQLDVAGEELTSLAKEMLDVPATTGPWRLVPLSVPTFDWQQLQAWNIDTARLPSGSVIRFEPPSVWARYWGWIVLGVALVLLQLMLLIGLLQQQRRRRVAELVSVNLGRRLITAHEDERKYIARELHDDLSQRLARLALDLSYVSSVQDRELVQATLGKIQPEVMRISKDVHDLSYRLHPSLIDDLGLVAAILAECERMQQHSGIVITGRIGELPAQVNQDTALCLYRIAQEALRNSVRHARAANINLDLHAEEQSLTLVVHDDGIGFEVLDRHQQLGLGLLSMSERAEIAGGSLVVTSTPGKGTVVTARIPLAKVLQ